MSKFKEAVIKVVRMVPRGRVVSYGQVALYVGLPRAARQVGWILRGMGKESGVVPWWRVVNNSGRISIKGSEFSPEDQKQLLVQEGVEVKPDLTFDIENYRYKPDEDFIKKLELDPHYLERIAHKLPFDHATIY